LAFPSSCKADSSTHACKCLAMVTMSQAENAENALLAGQRVCRCDAAPRRTSGAGRCAAQHGMAEAKEQGGDDGVKLVPLHTRRQSRSAGTWGALTGPKIMSTRYEDVEFTKYMTNKTNDYLKRRQLAAMKTDYAELEKSRRQSDPAEIKRRQRLFVDKTRDADEIRERFNKMFQSDQVRRAVSNSNKRRSDVPPVVNKGYLLGGFKFSATTEARRSFHTTPNDIVADDPDELREPREHRIDDMAHAYVNENHSQFKFPLRDYDRQAGKPWVATTGLNSSNWKDRSR
jgi:hypothetical protein